MNAAAAVRALTRAALDPDGPGTVGDLVGVVARATRSRGAVLWEAPDERRGVSALSVLGLWIDPTEMPPPGTSEVDALTRLAFVGQTLAVPDDLPDERPRLHGFDVAGALPVDYVDGCRGVLTLLGAHPLAGPAFDVAAELLELLPELCSAWRERQTLALVNACNSVLHDADVESRDRPLSREQLTRLLSEVCRLIADALHAAHVSIVLEDPEERPVPYRLSACANEVCNGGCSVADEPGDRTWSGATSPDGPLMEVRVLSGDQIIGFVRCRGSACPPQHFTGSDLALLRPVAAQVSRYWRNWLQRWALSDENESWRRLAAGMTSLNRLLAEELARPVRDRDGLGPVAEMAAKTVQYVVPDMSSATVHRGLGEAEWGAPAALAGTEEPTALALAQETVRTRRQQQRADSGDGAGWVLCTPIGVGDRVYGVLESTGPARTPPDNSRQVNEILADQLGLYCHLQDTLRHLYDARRTLELARRTEAEAMEDLKHQLVSPLRTATNRTESVLRGGRFDGRVETQLKAVRGLCRKATRVAMSAGVFATLSRGRMPVPKTELVGVDDLVRVLIAAADDAQVLCDPRRGLRFEVERDAVRMMGRRLASVDASFLQQCVGNLLDNAAKYGYAGTQVLIGAEVTSANLAIVVASTGIPIPPRDLARCLERNWRGPEARGTTGEGSGLGLWIVDHLMRAMGGRVVLAADADLTTVRLLLPFA